MALAAPDPAEPSGEGAGSFTGRVWRFAVVDERLAGAIRQRFDLPDVLARAVAGRVEAPDAVASFLEPRLRDLLPDPAGFRDMERAVARLVRAVTNGETIGLLADYDVDGATSAALFMRWLNQVGARWSLHVPDRIEEGYGPGAIGIDRLVASGATLLVTLDCGTTAFEPLGYAAERGVDVIVVDHHAAEPALPPALAVVNPNRLDEAGLCRDVAAVGVAFLLLVALNRALRVEGWFEGPGRPEPDLMGLLDLVALGTVCDVVPLAGLNRAFVAQGLKVMGRGANVGLATLAEVAGLEDRADAYKLGFVLGPRINAGGRVGRSDLGARLLATGSAGEALEIARALDDLNRERQALERHALEAAVVAAERCGHGAAIVVAGRDWHPGVIGIVASRLVERFARPACVVALDGAVGKGSGRSVPGLDLGAAVIEARRAGLLLAGGGHAMAAGFSLAEADLDRFRAFLAERFAGAVPEAGRRPPLRLDGAVLPEALDGGFLSALERIGPFGAGNPEPRFLLARVRLAHADVVGTGHLRCRFAGPGGGTLGAIAFRQAETELGRELLARRGDVVDVVGRVRADTWRGVRRPQLTIDDAAPARSP